jgi:hypothetical protein
MTPDRCPARKAVRWTGGTLCTVTGRFLKPGPCPPNCRHRPVEPIGGEA